jgi:hypothetical protein
MTHRSIASAVGVGPNTVSGWLTKLRQGRPLRLGAVACQKLVQAKPPTDGYVGTLIPQRKLRALARIGWSCDELTRRLRQRGLQVGMHTLWVIRSGRTERTHTWLANAIDDLYKHLAMTPGNSGQTVRLAGRQKWPGSLAWDDIDDPAAKPQGVDVSQSQVVLDESAIERRILGDRTARLHKGEPAEVVRRLVADGWSLRRIEDHTGVNAARYITRTETAEVAA